MTVPASKGGSEAAPLSGNRNAVEFGPGDGSGSSGDLMRACDGMAVAECEAA